LKRPHTEDLSADSASASAAARRPKEEAIVEGDRRGVGSGALAFVDTHRPVISVERRRLAGALLTSFIVAVVVLAPFCSGS